MCVSCLDSMVHGTTRVTTTFHALLKHEKVVPHMYCGSAAFQNVSPYTHKVYENECLLVQNRLEL
jgi:hypothetical protein